MRGASPSYVVQSNAFTWDMSNPLKDKVIREIEIVAPLPAEVVDEALSTAPTPVAEEAR